MKQLFIFLTLFVAFSITYGLNAEVTSKVGYPEGYRAWQHVKSMVIKPGHPLENPFRGIHHVYANNKALKGLKTGNYPEGSVLVFDLLNYDDTGNALTEGERKLIGVMEKDSRKFIATGGWGFEGFGGNSKSNRITKDGGKSCFDCHSSEKKHNYVFSKLRN